MRCFHKVIAAVVMTCAAGELQAAAAGPCGDEALDELISRNDVQAIRQKYSYVPVSPGACSQALQEKIAHLFDREEIAAALLPRLVTLDDPALTSLVMKDVEALARRRADRRKRCRAVIASYTTGGQPAAGVGFEAYGVKLQSSGTPGVMIARQKADTIRQDFAGKGVLRWNHVCTPPEIDQNLDNRDALPNPPQGVRREYASLGAISKASATGLDAKLASLLPDLSLYPPVDWSKVEGGRPEGVVLKALAPTWNVVERLRRGAEVPAPAGLMAMLKELENDPLDRGSSSSDTVQQAQNLLRLLMRSGSRESTEVLAGWIVRFSTLGDHNQREYALYESISQLGDVKPEARVDLAPIRRKVFENIPYPEIGKVTEHFAQAEQKSNGPRGNAANR